MTDGAPIRLTRDQVRRVDRLATSEYRIAGIVLMENAGRNAADIIRREYPAAQRVVIVCGVGNNGGDGLVIARHLHNAGWNVRILIAGEPDRMTPDTAVNFAITQAMKLPTVSTKDPAMIAHELNTSGSGEVIVDAILGTGFRGEVRAPLDGIIRAINAGRSRSVVAIDVPSGLDVDTGEPSNATVIADMTITFVAEKVGFSNPEALRCLGRVYVADIGAPRELIAQVAQQKPGGSAS